MIRSSYFVWCACIGIRASLRQLFPPQIGQKFSVVGTNGRLKCAIVSGFDKYRQLKLNHIMHSLNGNIINTQNLSLIQFNKGSSYYERVLPSMENLVSVHNPSICALSEANIDPADLPRVCSITYLALSKYNVEVSEPTPGFPRGRAAALVIKNIEYIRRRDIEPPGTSCVILELKISKFKKLFILSWYREWQYIGHSQSKTIEQQKSVLKLSLIFFLQFPKNRL